MIKNVLNYSYYLLDRCKNITFVSNKSKSVKLKTDKK